MKPDLKDMLAEAREELRWRRWVYPRRVTDGVMKDREMARKIALQEAIVERLQEDYRRETAAADLFGRSAPLRAVS